MKVLVTGGTGLLGWWVVKELVDRGFTVYATYNQKTPHNIGNEKWVKLNLEDIDSTIRTVHELRPDVVIHCAAYTDVDGCELKKDYAYRVNYLGTKALAHVSRGLNCYFVYISTDYVFDGEKGLYTEEDIPNPVNYYGLTKLLGEVATLSILPEKSCVVRVSGLYGISPTGKKNFGLIALEALLKDKEVKAFYDQYLSPTYVKSLAQCLSKLIERNVTGIIHIAGERVSRYEFALKIPVAGEGTRLRPLTFTTPKPLIPVLGKPFIAHIIEHLRNSNIHDIVLVVGYLNKLFREVLANGSSLGVSIRYVVQEERLGIAHAIYRAIEDGSIDGPFVVYLGDNYFDEGTSRFVREFIEGNYDVFIVLTRVKDPTRFGYVVLEDGKVRKLIEKPKSPPPGGYTLAGFYAFRDPDLVVKAFRDLRPSWRGEYEITDLIQWFVDRGYNVGYTITNGWWKDIGTPDDLLDLIYLMLDKIETKIEGEVEGEVRGRVVVEKGAVVEGKVYGPAYIGKGAYIGKNATIEHYSSVEENTQILSGHIVRSLIMSNVTLNLNKLRLVDSIVGRYSKITCTRELHGTIRLLISDHSYIEL